MLLSPKAATCNGRAARYRPRHDRLDFVEPANPLFFAPAEKLDRGAMVGRARVRIADRDGEEFEETDLGPLPCPGDECRQRDHLPCRRVSNDREIAHAGPTVGRPNSTI